MIANRRQYLTAKAQLQSFRVAVGSFDPRAVSGGMSSHILAQAELDALKSELEILEAETHEYEELASGAVKILKAKALAELPDLLIKARIANGLSQRALAAKLKLQEQQVQRYEAERYASASLRRLIEVAAALQLNISEIAEIRDLTSSPGRVRGGRDGLAWNRFPVEEMYRRGWFQGFAGPLSEVTANGEELVRNFVHRIMPRPVAMLLHGRARVEPATDRYALLAWQCRVCALAHEVAIEKSYDPRVLTEEWVMDLVRQSRYDDGPMRAAAHLAAAGVRLVVEPHLPKTYLDGAAFLCPKGVPVVALTLRYDRLDNFWFVLLHEVVHVLRHLRKGHVESILDDFDTEADETDEIEHEAARVAGSFLIPDALWETALPRYLRTEESVRDFAAESMISPAIVAGRIRREAGNYTILGGLVGQGEVRRLFPEVRFAQ